MDGYKYVWIDTCCIDKRDSSELTEAINSMYMWYKSAAICYVYLVDLSGNCPRLGESHTSEIITEEFFNRNLRLVELCAITRTDMTVKPVPIQPTLRFMGKHEVEGRNEDEHADEHKSLEGGDAGLSKADWVSRVGRCRWFRRGWTLQELIAPKQVLFFGMKWNFIGSKTDLLQIISHITGIDSIALSHRCKLEELSVAKRLSWAAHRTTTRIEDKTYSLLGLLNINMTLFYGEGEKAFTRLQEEIIRRSADSSVFAWFRGTENALLASSPSLFAGCGKVILCGGATITHSFELTHRGLKMKLPTLERNRKSADETFLAVLGCRMEDDFERLLCLHLQEEIVDPTDSGGAIVCSIKKCAQLCAKSQSQHWNATRLHSIDSRKLRQAEYRTVLLPRHNFQSHDSNSVLTIMSSVWIKTLTASLQIVEVFPTHQWNIETRVMNKYKDLALNNFTQCGGVLLRHELNNTVALCFVIKPGQEFIKILNGAKEPLQKSCKSLESRLLCSQITQRQAVHQFRALPSRSLVRLQATLELDMHEGESVWCVVLSQM